MMGRGFSPSPSVRRSDQSVPASSTQSSASASASVAIHRRSAAMLQAKAARRERISTLHPQYASVLQGLEHPKRVAGGKGKGPLEGGEGGGRAPPRVGGRRRRSGGESGGLASPEQRLEQRAPWGGDDGRGRGTRRPSKQRRGDGQVWQAY
eukprot:COSAG01_NODE_978_length_12357_cov_10.838554_1_plen_151_part_00